MDTDLCLFIILNLFICKLLHKMSFSVRNEIETDAFNILISAIGHGHWIRG